MDIKKTVIGNTVIYTHSPLANFSDQEKKKWFEAEKVKGNPILKEIEAAVNACYQN